MHSEYAVDPVAIGADWKTFRYLIEKFGADKGRLISRMPKKWERKVLQAARAADVSTMRLHDIVEQLNNAKHKVVDFRRDFDHEADWIVNALREHGKRPFRAVISSSAVRGCEEVLQPDDCSDGHPLFNAPISQEVVRTADDIANSLLLLAAVAQEIDIVDPYFDLRPTKGDYVGPLASLLARLAAAPGPPKAVRVHFRSHDSRPPSEILARDGAAQTVGLLPQGYCLELYEWSQVPGGEDLHDRFFLTDIGGIMIGAGLSAEGLAETATFTLLDFEHVQRLRSRFAAGSTVYTRVGSAVRINADGNAELF